MPGSSLAARILVHLPRTSAGFHQSFSATYTYPDPGQRACDHPLLGHGRDLIPEDPASRTEAIPGSRAVDEGVRPERPKRISTAAVPMCAGLPWREAERRGVPSRGPSPVADLGRVDQVALRVGSGLAPFADGVHETGMSGPPIPPQSRYQSLAIRGG